MIEDLEETLDASIAQAAVVGNKILQSMNEAFQLDDHTHNNSASIGIAMFTGQETSSAELLKQADIAMYSAKESGRNAVRFFDTRMQGARGGTGCNRIRFAAGTGQQSISVITNPRWTAMGTLPVPKRCCA